MGHQVRGVGDLGCDGAVVLVVQDDVRPDVWAAELEKPLVRIGHRYGRVDLRRRMRDYVHGLLAPVARKNSWQLAAGRVRRSPHPCGVAAPAEPSLLEP
jgi:hypothetical protein